MVNTTIFPRTLGLGLGIGSQMRALGHSSKITWPLDNFRDRQKVKNVKVKTNHRIFCPRRNTHFLTDTKKC